MNPLRVLVAIVAIVVRFPGIGLAQDRSPSSLTEVWDSVLTGTYASDVIVPDGEAWLIGPGVTIRGNLRTEGGTIAMRPGSSYRMLGRDGQPADPASYVGGGMRYTESFANDIGLWIGGTGVLDIRCTPKVGWNRTGEDSSWNAGDELWIAPTNRNDYTPRRWYPGDTIPRVHERVPPAEIINVTRDCEILGPGHIHISASVPSRIEYVTLRELGITNSVGTTSGRYALHFHMQGAGSRGTIVRGVASIDAGGRVFVPHTSHGVTMEDIVAVDSYAEAFWWDLPDLTNDITVDRLAVAGVRRSGANGVVLPKGSGMTMTNSAVSGARGSDRSQCYQWEVSSPHLRPGSRWTFEGNVAHNCRGNGIRFWLNDGFPHHVREYVSYRNHASGIMTGAYANPIQYSDILLIEDNLHHHSGSRFNHEHTQVAGYNRLEIHAPPGRHAVTWGPVTLTQNQRVEFVDCKLIPGAGVEAIQMGGRSNGSNNPILARFRNCTTTGGRGLSPSDILWVRTDGRGQQGSHVIIENADGSGWDIRIRDGRVTTTPR